VRPEGTKKFFVLNKKIQKIQKKIWWTIKHGVVHRIRVHKNWQKVWSRSEKWPGSQFHKTFFALIYGTSVYKSWIALATSVVCTTGKSYWGGRLSTVDLLVLTMLDHLFLYWKYYFPFFTKQATVMRRSTVLNHSPQLVFPGHFFALVGSWPYSQTTPEKACQSTNALAYFDSESATKIKVF